MNMMKRFWSRLVGIHDVVPSCNTNDLAKAEITILYSATQGQVLQTRPIEGVEVSVPRNDGTFRGN